MKIFSYTADKDLMGDLIGEDLLICSGVMNTGSGGPLLRSPFLDLLSIPLEFANQKYSCSLD
jgi:hypothetical protein